MNTDQVAEKLVDLIKLDIDAVQAYEQALKQIDHPEAHQKISEFRDDHKRHITDLTELLRNMNYPLPSMEPDMKGFFIEGFTVLRSVTGTAGALKAMNMNEKLTNAIYKKALENELPLNVKVIVEKNYSDEKRHLAYIEEAIKNEIWKNNPIV